MNIEENKEKKLTSKEHWENIFKEGKKECSRCEEILLVNLFAEYPISKRGYRYLYSHCKNCDRKRTAKFKNKKSETIEGRASFLLTNLNRRCRDKNLVSEIDLEYIVELWNKQNGKCYYTGLDMELKTTLEKTETKTNKMILSIDRKNSSLGYTKDNVVLCCWCVNNIKQDLTIEELKYWASLILNPK